MAIAITEEFNDSQGRLAFYNPYISEDRIKLEKLKHVDLGAFRSEAIVGDLDALNEYTMTEIDLFSVGELEAGLFGSAKATWSAGEPSLYEGRLPSLLVNLTAGDNVFSYIHKRPIDLLTGFEDDDSISVALPGFPTGSVDLAASTMTLSADPFGSFSTNSSTVTFSESSPAISSSLFTEFRVPRSAFDGIDLSTVYGIKFNIVATGPATMRVLAIRLLGKDWTYGQVDVNTLNGTLVRTPPIDGDFARTYDRGNGIMWRSGGQESADPRPIDAEVGAVFNTGKFFPGREPKITLYFRELTEDFLTQLDLNGFPQSFFQGKIQPDVGDAMYNPRYMTDLDNVPQTNLGGIQLNNRNQYDLERTPDYLSASYVFSSIQWNSGRTLIQCGTSETAASTSAGYPYAFDALDEDSNYVLFSKVEENSFRVKLFKILANANNQLELVFDTRLITDSSTIKRRKGRFGWKAELPTSASVDSIRSRGEVYAEYRSSQFESDTPIEGAELFVQASPDEELYTTLVPAFSNVPGVTVVSTDTSRSTSGLSWKIENGGAADSQGIASNEFLIRDFDNISLTLDIYYPKSRIDAGEAPRFQLVSADGKRFGNLTQPRLYGDQWEALDFNLPFGEEMLSGSYRLVITQPGQSPATWWVDKVSIRDRVIAWSGRAEQEDAWGATRAKWQPFNDIKNAQNNGVMFDEKGRHLQIRARSYRPDGEINRIQTVPKYAQLGRLVFDQDATYSGTGPQLSFPDPTDLGSNTRSFKASVTDIHSSNDVASLIWYFGDGKYAYGENVNHRYAENGDFVVTLVALDTRNNRSSITRTITV